MIDWHQGRYGWYLLKDAGGVVQWVVGAPLQGALIPQPRALQSKRFKKLRSPWALVSPSDAEFQQPRLK